MEIPIYDISTCAQAVMEQMFRKWRLIDGVPSLSTTMRATPSSLDKASIYSLHFPREMDEYESLNLIEGFFDGVAPEDDYWHELDQLVMT